MKLLQFLNNVSDRILECEAESRMAVSEAVKNEALLRRQMQKYLQDEKIRGIMLETAKRPPTTFALIMMDYKMELNQIYFRENRLKHYGKKSIS